MIETIADPVVSPGCPYFCQRPQKDNLIREQAATVERRRVLLESCLYHLPPALSEVDPMQRLRRMIVDEIGGPSISPMMPPGHTIPLEDVSAHG